MPYAPLTLFNGCPSFFQDFNDRLVKDHAGRSLAAANRIQLAQTGLGLHYVDGLQSAASKWRLAEGVTGLSYSDISDVSDLLATSYSAQARVSLSVVAFEAFARIFLGGNWPDAQVAVFTAHNPALCSEVRSMLNTDGLFTKLHSSANPAQQARLNNFQNSGRDDELYPVCVAIRNAFAHGAIGGMSCVIDAAPKLQMYALNGIRQYCDDLGT